MNNDKYAFTVISDKIPMQSKQSIKILLLKAFSVFSRFASEQILSLRLVGPGIVKVDPGQELKLNIF